MRWLTDTEFWVLGPLALLGLVALGIFGVGAWIFRQLRPHFADVV